MEAGLTGASLTARASRDAAEAATAAGVAIRPLATLEEFEEAARVLTASFQNDLADNFLFAQLNLTGNYVVGAYAGAELIATTLGFFGRREGSNVLHSLLTGVRPDTQHRGVGLAIKLHQRSWALEHGASVITWTFDPLLRRNAYFNIEKLGAKAVAYVANMFGPAHGIYERTESDCLLAEWKLAVARPLEPRVESARVAEFRARGAEPILELTAGAPIARHTDATTRLCQIPDDVLALRRRDPQLAQRWQHAAREALTLAFADGYVVSSFIREGWYVLTRN